jgi:cation diffusion facilitator CzcD-associated flavoprotein CzcO
MDWTFAERYSSWPDLRRYFKYVNEKWKIDDHVQYNKNVETALWDDQKHQWWVECTDGTQIYCRWLIPCLGFASKHYRPPFPGLGNFAGELYHTAFWPQYGVNVKGKKLVHAHPTNPIRGYLLHNELIIKQSCVGWNWCYWHSGGPRDRRRY